MRAQSEQSQENDQRCWSSFAAIIDEFKSINDWVSSAKLAGLKRNSWDTDTADEKKLHRFSSNVTFSNKSLN